MDERFSDGRAGFDYAQFSNATVTFNRAHLKDGSLAFHRARFTGGTLSFDHAHFTGGAVARDDAEFTGGSVTFYAARFDGGNVTFVSSPSPRRAGSRSVWMYRTSIRGVPMDFACTWISPGAARWRPEISSARRLIPFYRDPTRRSPLR